MSIEIKASGPATRYQTGRSHLTAPSAVQDEILAQPADYRIVRVITDPDPNLGYYLTEPTLELVNEIVENSAATDWQADVVDADQWTIEVDATPDAILASAKAAAREQDRPTSRILLDWVDHERAPTESILSAWKNLTGLDAPTVWHFLTGHDVPTVAPEMLEEPDA